MDKVLEYLSHHHQDQVRQLGELVAVPSISTDGEHGPQVEQSASVTCEQMRQAGLQNVEMLRCDNSYPYAYGEWLGAPGKPTVFLYAHHDVQPVNFEDQWKSPPFQLTPRDGRLFGRGSADDKAAIVAQLGAVTGFLKTKGELPVNVKMVVEGEEEVGSTNLQKFFQQYRDKIRADAIVVCDTGNVDTGIPSITYSLRGIVAVLVEVQGMHIPVHSGVGGGFLPDAALALNAVLARLLPKNGKYPIPQFYDRVRKMSVKEKRALKKLPGDETRWHEEFGLLPHVGFASPKGRGAYEQTWRFPAITIIAQEASSIKGASNQVLPKASAIVSCRIVPDQDPNEVYEQLRQILTKDPPWGVKVDVRLHGPAVPWWMTDPNGPAFTAALKALKAGFGRDAVAIGCGGTIGFVGPLAELFDGAPALLLGIEDPKGNAHAPNESLHEGDWHKLTASLAHLFSNLGNLPDGKVKASPAAEPTATEAEPTSTPTTRAEPEPTATVAP